jgi:hypothetical protein
MYSWNLPPWLFSFFRSTASSPNPIGSSGGGDTYTTSQAFGIDGFLDLQSNRADALIRIDGEAGEAYFGEDPSRIVDFVDGVLEVCTLCTPCKRVDL